MWKWMFRTGRLLVTAVLVCFVSVWTTGYIVNSYLDTVLKQMGLPLQVQPPGLTDIWAKLWRAGTQKEHEPGKNPRGSGVMMESGASAENWAADEAWSNRAAGGQAEYDGWQGDFLWEEDLSSGEAGQPKLAPPQDGPQLGAGDGRLAISEEERETLRAIMMQLNEEELLQLARLLADGWTVPEWEAAAALLRNALSPEDYNILMEILNKAAAQPAYSPHSSENQAF